MIAPATPPKTTPGGPVKAPASAPSSAPLAAPAAPRTAPAIVPIADQSSCVVLGHDPVGLTSWASARHPSIDNRA